MSKQQVYGEGNYEASRAYNDATKRFAESGKVDKAAHDAAPASDAEALQLAAAEAEGKRRAKEEDPILTRKARKAPEAGDKDAERRDDRDVYGSPGDAPEETRTPRPGEER